MLLRRSYYYRVKCSKIRARYCQIKYWTIIHDYEDIMGYFTEYSESNRRFNTNVVCPEGEGYEDQINATIRVSMGGGLCSASIVNNTLNDRTPYVLFADHCVVEVLLDMFFFLTINLLHVMELLLLKIKVLVVQHY